MPENISEQFNEGDAVFALTQNGDSPQLLETTVIGRRGSDLYLQRGQRDAQGSTMFVHRTNVFTEEQVATAADDLLPSPSDGEERMLSTALREVFGDPDSNKELLVRLAGVAMGDRLNAPRDMADYGYRSLEDLVGDVHARGTNMWKVENLITFEPELPELTNTLSLARTNGDELSHLSVSEAANIRAEISDTNRSALNQMYDHYDVSYENAQAFEASKPDGSIVRITLYPSATEALYFIEQTTEPHTTAPEWIQISRSAPQPSEGSPYMRVL